MSEKKAFQIAYENDKGKIIKDNVVPKFVNMRLTKDVLPHLTKLGEFQNKIIEDTVNIESGGDKDMTAQLLDALKLRELNNGNLNIEELETLQGLLANIVVRILDPTRNKVHDSIKNAFADTLENGFGETNIDFWDIQEMETLLEIVTFFRGTSRIKRTG